MNLTKTIKQLLRGRPELRDSDKKLIWAVWKKEDKVHGGILTFENFKDSITPSSIARARRKVQENHPELQARREVKRAREEKAKLKGTHVYNEKLF